MADATSITAKYIQRKHPDYDRLKPHWDFLEATYRGGRDWFDDNVFRYLKEGDKEFTDRLARAYRFNHTREVVDLITKYLFKGQIVRQEDAPDEIKTFWKSATRKGAGIATLMREGSRMGSIYGRAYLVVDSTARSPEEGGPKTRADQKASDSRVYAYWVRPQNVLDASWDDEGNLNWILIYESARDDEDFFTSEFREWDKYRLWTREDWFLFKKLPPEKGKREVRIELEDSNTHDLGFVPVLAFDDRESDSDYSAPALIDDIAYLDRAIANYLSNLDAIIQDQTFSQLTIPAQGLLPGQTEYDAVIEMGTKRVFIYDSEGGEPKYIAPDPKQAQLILAVITKIITEIYHTVGMAGERTKMDNAAGIDNSSGVAKAYDFDRMNTMLANKATRLQDVENRVADMVMRWHGQELEEEPVTYPDEFDTRGLYDEFDIGNRLALIGAPDEVRRHQMTKLVDKLFPQLPAKVKAAIEKEIKQWPPEMEELGGPGLRDRKKATADNAQGQNNSQETKTGEAA